MQLTQHLPGDLVEEFERMSAAELAAAVALHLPHWSALFAVRGDPRMWADLHRWPVGHQYAVVELYDEWRIGAGVWRLSGKGKAA